MKQYTYDEALANRASLLDLSDATTRTQGLWDAVRNKYVEKQKVLSRQTAVAQVCALTYFLLTMLLCFYLYDEAHGTKYSAPVFIGCMVFLAGVWYLIDLPAYHDLSAFSGHDFEPIRGHEYAEVMTLAGTDKVALAYVKDVLAQPRELILAELVALRHRRHELDREFRVLTGDIARAMLTGENPASASVVDEQIRAINFYRDHPIYALQDLRLREGKTH